MATIKLKRSSVAGKVPTTGQLEYGELAVNTADGKIYLKRSGSISDEIFPIFTIGAQNSGSAQFTGSFNVSNDINATTVSASNRIHTPLMMIGLDSGSLANSSLVIANEGTSPISVRLYNYSLSPTNGPRLYAYRRQGTSTAVTNLDSSLGSYILGEFRFHGYVFDFDVVSSKIVISSTGSFNSSSFMVPSKMEFYTGTEGDFSTNLAIKIDDRQMLTAYHGVYTDRLMFMSSSTGRYIGKISTDTSLSGSSNTAIVTENAIKTYVDASILASTSSGLWTGSNGEIKRYSNVQITGSYPLKLLQPYDGEPYSGSIQLYRTSELTTPAASIVFYRATEAYPGFETLYGGETLGSIQFKGYNEFSFVPSTEIASVLSSNMATGFAQDTHAGELQFKVVRYAEESLSNLLLINANLTSSYGLQVSKFGLGSNKRKVTAITTDITLSGSSDNTIPTENAVKTYVNTNKGLWTGSNGEIKRLSNVKITGSLGVSSNITSSGSLNVKDTLKAGGIGVRTAYHSITGSISITGRYSSEVFSGQTDARIKLHNDQFAESTTGYTLLTHDASGQTALINTRNDSAGAIKFVVRQVGGSYVIPLRINRAGAIGVHFTGSNSPAALLHISASNTTIPSFLIERYGSKRHLGFIVDSVNQKIVFESGSNLIFGTQPQSFRVFNNGITERMRIEGSNGYVGINNSSPQKQLDVTGNARITGNLEVTGTLDTRGNNAKFGEVGGVTVFTSSIAPFQVNTSDSWGNPFTIGDSADIGGNTASPALLMWRATGETAPYRWRVWRHYSDGNGYYIDLSSAVSASQYGELNSKFASTTPFLSMRQSSGFVGIGIQGASEKLHVAGNITGSTGKFSTAVGIGSQHTAGGTYRIDVVETGNVKLRLKTTSGNQAAIVFSDAAGTGETYQIGVHGGVNAFKFSQNETFTNPEITILSGSGYIGINKDSPKTDLDIVGNTAITGSLSSTSTGSFSRLKVTSTSSLYGVHIGNATNQNLFYPLTFDSEAGGKISLYDDGTANVYGIGIQGNQLEFFTPSTARISFGRGKSGALAVETFTINNSNSRVGVLNATPACTLDVNGNTQITGSIQNISTSNPALFVRGNILNNGAFTGQRKSTIHIRGAESSFTSWQGISFGGANFTQSVAKIEVTIASSGSAMYFGTSNAYANGVNNRALTISRHGRVGISGNPNPTVELEVKGTISASSDVHIAGISVGNRLTKVEATASLVYPTWRGSNGNIYTYSPTSSMYISSSGNVGIGTAKPRAKLHIYSATSGSSVFLVEGQSGELFQIFDEVSGSLLSISDVSGLPIFEVFDTDKVVMGSYGANTLVVTGSKVGIGTATPTVALDIVGSITASGDIGAVGNIYGAAKLFDIPHPTKEGKRLRHGSLEGPEHSVYVRGRLYNNNRIELPDYWKTLVHEDSITVQLTSVGEYRNLYVIHTDVQEIIVGCSDYKAIDCYYFVQAERKDIPKLEVER